MKEGRRMEVATAKERSAAPRAGRAERSLFKTVAARCRGRTLVLGRDSELLAAAIRDRRLEVMALEPGDPAGGVSVAVASRPGEAGNGAACFDTAVLAGLLEHVPEETAARVLAEVWPLLRPGGRLIAIVPNEDSRPDRAAGRQFDRRSLRKLLRPFGKPRLTTEQPLRWLMMHVGKPKEGKPQLSRALRERYRVTAKLCRGRVIDLGCGEGHLAGMLAGRGLQVVGVDVGTSKIESARTAYPAVRFILSDIRTLDLPDASFDTAVLAEVLEHVPDGPGDGILAVAWRLLKPGGRLIVSVPNRDCIAHPNHVREFDRRSLRRMLEPLGRPRLVTDQPYKWLMMYVEKRHD
jgi:2-polyprenyl-3-methyl-5-hydroxy-6-metoxy-1,4-benzoquinol methylase